MNEEQMEQLGEIEMNDELMVDLDVNEEHDTYDLTEMGEDGDPYDLPEMGNEPTVIYVEGEITILGDETCDFKMDEEYISDLPDVQYSVVGFRLAGTSHKYREIQTYCIENNIDQGLFDSLCYEKESGGNIEDFFMNINGGEFIRTDFYINGDLDL